MKFKELLANDYKPWGDKDQIYWAYLAGFEKFRELALNCEGTSIHVDDLVELGNDEIESGFQPVAKDEK